MAFDAAPRMRNDALCQMEELVCRRKVRLVPIEKDGESFCCTGIFGGLSIIVSGLLCSLLGYPSRPASGGLRRLCRSVLLIAGVFQFFL